MTNKKIAILTFHRAVNYGAILQAYALQATLEKKGFTAEILDYRNEAIEKNYYSPMGIGNTIGAKIKSLVLFPVQKKRNKAFCGFYQTHLKTSSLKYDLKNIRDVEKNYDYFVVGSDQVWNLRCTNYDATYFLDFVPPSKRISYAASLGKYEETLEDYMKYIQYIEEFKRVSVREKAGQEYLNQRINEEITVDIDPTFLLSKEEWMSMSATTSHSDYIFLYSVNLNSDVLFVGRKLAKKTKKKLIILTLRNKPLKLQENEVNLSGVSPEEFLGFIDHAHFVVTNSFHGAAFSIIFNKDFYLVKNKKHGLDNSRLEMLLNIFGLEDRMVDASLDTNLPKISFTEVNQVIEDARERSLNHLCTSMKA